MKRRLVTLVASVVAATAVSIGPASASSSADCVLGDPPPPTAIEGGGQIRIYPDRVPNDALATGGWILDYVACLEGGTIASIIECLGELGPSGDYVWYDEETGAIVIDYQRIRNDWFAQPQC